MKSFLLLVLSLQISLCLFAQNSGIYRPELIAQSGFSFPFPTDFAFSAKNNYLYGYNLSGEYLFYDLRSNRLIKRIVSAIPGQSPVFYIPRPDFSRDEKMILIPQHGEGGYELFDIMENRTVKTFTPDAPAERISHGFFSADGKNLLLISQTAGDEIELKLSFYTIDGARIKTCYLKIPPLIEVESPLVRLVMGKKYLNSTRGISKLTSVGPSGDLNVLTFGFVGGGLHIYVMEDTKDGGHYVLDKRTLVLPPNGSRNIKGLYFWNNRLVAKVEGELISLANDFKMRSDTLLVIEPVSGQIERKVESTIPVYPDAYKSIGLNFDLQTSNRLLNVYFRSQVNGDDFTISCFDLMSNREIFTYGKGESHPWYNRRPFKGGEINGGYILAVSDDQQLMLENSRNLLVHNLESRKIRNVISATKGGILLNQPVFIDSFRLLIPKVTNDAFIFDLRTGKIDRLKRETDCQDTARYGANVYFPLDPTALLGLETAAISAPDGKLAILNYRPADLCGFPSGKQIDVYDEQLKLEKSFRYIDREYSYNLHFVPAKVPTFLSYYKLISFPENGEPVVHELKITQKKQVYYAANPVYLPATGTIFTIMGTREAPGSPDLIFAHYDLEGKLLNSYQYKREKTPYKFQTYIFEAQVSPDQTKLLFGLHDGTAGVFDIKNMKMLGTYEHGDAIWLKPAGIYEHNAIYSGCFIDNTHFVTAGDDGKIRTWDISQPKSTGVLNLEPAFFYGLKLTPDKRYLVGPDAEKAIRFIDVKTGEAAFRIISPDHESAAVISKDGYYTANKKSIKSLTFLRSGRAYDFSQFDLYLNRPDKILEEFGYASPETINLYRKAFAKRTEKTDSAGISNKIFSPGYAAPEIVIKDLPAELAETGESSLKLTLTASDASSVISTLFVTVNGVPLYGTKGLRLKQAKAGASLEIPLEIPLSSGNNAITISVMNRNKVESLRENINIRRTGVAPKPNLYMIAIGSGASLNKDKKLEFPAKDASDVAALLSRSPLFDKVQQTLLVNEKVTRPAFIKLKEQLLKTRPDDYVVVFYSGHGILDTALNYYLSTYDTDFNRPKAKAIAYDDFENLLDSIPSRNKVLLLDACHSGEADREAMKGGFRTTKGDLQMEGGLAVKSGSRLIPGAPSSFHLMQSLFSDLRTSNGATIIAAAGASQYAVEGETWKNGVFTYSLKSALEEKKADLNKDGIIYLSELLEYLQGRVVELTNGNQQPCSRKENIVNDLAIWQ